MALTVPYVAGEYLMLQYILGLATVGTGPVLHIYSNDPTISNATVIGQLTECTSGGYAPISLLSAGWTTVQASNITSAVYSSQTFSFSTNAVTYGYYVTDSSSANSGRGNLLWVERFSGAPFSIPDSGGTESIAVRLTLA